MAHWDLTEVVLLTKEELQALEKENPWEVLKFYKYIIEVTNRRLTETGKELALMSEAPERIETLSQNGEKGFKDIVDYITSITWVDYVIFIERHPVVSNLFVYKYNSLTPSLWPINKKASEHIAKLTPETVSSIPIEGTGVGDDILVSPLATSTKQKGFFVLGKKPGNGKIADTAHRIMKNISPILASIVDDNHEISAQKAKELKRI